MATIIEEIKKTNKLLQAILRFFVKYHTPNIKKRAEVVEPPLSILEDNPNNDWEKDLIELCKFTEEEGFDPDRFHCFTSKTLKAQRENMIKVIEGKLEAIMANDKTEKYGYFHDSKKIYLNADGQEPPIGERWKTPKELAKDIIKALKEND